MYYYTAYQLTFASSFPLPEFTETLHSEPYIQISKIAESVDNVANDGKVVVKKMPDGISIDWNGIGRYDIYNGSEVFISPRQNVSHEVSRIPLFSVVLAAILQQNDIFVLHGSAVEINGKATIFLGGKGFGKSSLTAALINRGHNLISDDVTAISFCCGSLKVLPGIPIIKLWPDTIRAIGFDVHHNRALYPGITKRLCTIREKFYKQSLPLGSIFILGYGDTLEIKELKVSKKLLFLSVFHYFSHFRTAFSDNTHCKILNQCNEIAAQTDMYKFIRRVDLREIEGACRIVENHLST